MSFAAATTQKAGTTHY